MLLDSGWAAPPSTAAQHLVRSCIASHCKINKPTLRIGGDQLRCYLVAHIETLAAADYHPIHVRVQRPDKGSVLVHAGHNGREALPDDPVTWTTEQTPLLLFPCKDAIPLDAWRADHAAKAITLIVPDGTWRQTNRVRRRVPGLAAIQAVSLTSTQASNYRLRRTHVGSRLATFEAIALALGILEGPAIEAHLLHVFRAIVDRALWSNGRLSTEEVTGGIPAGARQDGPANGPLGRQLLTPAHAKD